jgi:hypothetical protein
VGNDGLNVRIAPRRAGGDTRRSPLAHRRACQFKGGLSAAVLPPPQLCTPLFARHCRRFPTQNRASGRFEGPEFWRFAREGRFDIRQLVYLLFMTKGQKLCQSAQPPSLSLVSDLVSRVLCRITFDQSELSITRIPPTASPNVRPGRHP